MTFIYPLVLLTYALNSCDSRQSSEALKSSLYTDHTQTVVLVARAYYIQGLMALAI